MNKEKYLPFFKILFCVFIWASLIDSSEAQTITRPTISGPSGLEVNSYTGNLLHQRTDMVIPGKGLSIDITFSFNSVLDTLDWGLGFGWTFTYNMLYRTDSLGIVILRMDGREDLFTLNNGNYTAPTGVFDDLEEYQTGKFRLTTKYGLKYFFDDASHKKLTKIEDLNNNDLTLTYSGGYLSTIINASGRSLHFNWSDGHLVEIEDNNLATSRIISYLYEDSLLTSITDPEGYMTTYTYDEQVLLTQMTDKNGSPTSIIYYPTSQVKEFITCESNQRITYHEDLTFVVEQSSAGNLVTVFNFDEAGRVIAIKNPAGATSTFVYDSQDNLVQYSDYSDNAFIYAYDDIGNRTSVTNPLGYQTQYTYTANNRLASFTDENGNQSNYTYDTSGNLIMVNRPLGSSESYTYDASGNLIQITDGNGNATNFNYDAPGNLEGINYPVGGVDYEYDAVGNITKIIGHLNNATLFTYNSLNQLISIEDPLGHTTTFTYDGNGNLLTETDANDNVKTYVYDPLNRLVSVSIPAGTTAYQYDAIGNLLKITDANGNSTQFTYNNQNLVTSEQDALGNTTFYTYDSNGNLLQKIDANGNTTSYTYDILGRLVSRVYSENSDYYNYDATGNLTHAINNRISISYNYDALNRLISKSIDSWNKTIQYTYDSAGNRASMTDPDGGLTTYVYDINNRLISLTNPLNQHTTFEYDVAGRTTRQNNANGTFSTYTYDNRSNLLNLTNSKSNNDLISSYTYTYDDFGNRLTMADLTGTHYYTYDDNHRLTDVTYANGDTESFAYDGAGNRIQLQKNGVTTNYSYNTANQILTANNVSYTFDNNGNMTSKTEDGETTTYVYDTQNRLIWVELSNGTTNEFGYDSFGEKTYQTNIDNEEKKFFYDDANLLLELNESHETLCKFTQGRDLDSWLSIHTNNDTYTYHKDGLANITGLTSDGENLENNYTYGVFGSFSTISENIDNHIGFTGRRYESDIKLYYFRTRFLDIENGRFLKKDILPKNHPYTYVENNPVTRIDPLGAESSPYYVDPVGVWNAYLSIESFLRNGEKKELRSVFPMLLDAGGTVTSIGSVFVPILRTSWIAGTIDAGKTFCYFANGDVDNGIGTLITGGANLGQNILIGKYIAASATLTGAAAAGTGVLLSAAGAGSYYATDYLVGDYFREQGGELYDFHQRERAKFRKKLEQLRNLGNQAKNFILFELLIKQLIEISNIRPLDPNEIIPPAGYSTSQWMSINDNFNYKILFENDPDFATSPAQKVVITLPLDEHLNPYSLQINDFGFGDFLFEVPENTNAWSQRLDVVDSLGVFVDVTAGLDISKNEAFWIFESIDPATGLASTVAVDGGFLPVNDTLIGNGEGFVTFTIRPGDLSVTGDSIAAQANILFDTEDVIKTNIGVNIVDAVAPTSALLPLPENSDTTAIILNWTGLDDTIAVGVSHYEIYVSQDGGGFYLYQENIDTTALEFIGEEGSDYAFFTRAIDNVGNKEALKLVGEDTISIRKELQISPRVHLQGPYEPSLALMRDNLRMNGLIPLAEPYTALGYTHVGNSSKTTSQAVLNIIGNDAIVDWLFLELRHKLDSTVVVASRSALLQRDGDVVDIDGISPVAFTNVLVDDYYLVVKHRNHLGVMSASPISISRTASIYDFTTSDSKTFGAINGIALLNDGRFGLYSGDFNRNGQIQNTDYSAMILTVGTSGYMQGDFDLNSQIQNTDVQLQLLPNIGRGQQFPE